MAEWQFTAEEQRQWYIKVNTPNEVIPNLWISGQGFAASLALINPLGIQAVLNVGSALWDPSQGHNPTPIVYDKHESIRYIELPFFDGHEIPEDTFRAAVAALENTHGKGMKTLVHCHAGISRSVTIAASYMVGKWVGTSPFVKSKKFIDTLESALDHILINRSLAQPAPAVWRSAKKHLRLWPYDGSFEE